ncbi:MAG: PEP-utilizing enzyme, partial [Parvibaculales bacterium]
EGHVEEREKAYKELLEGSPKHESKKLKKYYENIHRFAPSRDTLKYIFVLINHTLRKLVLRDGGKLVAAGKIEMVEDVFFLTFEELVSGADLKKLIAKRKPFFQMASANVQAFPIFIDSRGRIVTAEAEQGESDDPNILKGNGISRGVVRGRVKVLKDPREKKIEKGDILVTYNTDPGWTPLFVGASGIILEIGAVLQHGGVVAREYAKPCVAGIRGITQKLHDGQEVEVDGTNGIVKILD